MPFAFFKTFSDKLTSWFSIKSISVDRKGVSISVEISLCPKKTQADIHKLPNRYYLEWQLVSGSLGENDTVTENIEIRAIFEKDEAPAFVKGDINNDGEIDTSDSSLILKYDAGFVELSEEQISAGDLNSDGGVDAADANYILRYDAGLISELWYFTSVKK